MREGKRRFFLILLMTTISLVVAGITIAVLYKTAFEEQEERLVETAQSQARLIEAVARFDVRYSKGDFPGGSTAATLSQITDAHGHYRGFGETGEFTLASHEGDTIVFLLRHRHYDLDKPRPVAFDSKLAEPMRRALSGLSGTVVGLDYRGVTVLAAYEPVSELDLGIVAKIDLDEIREPFLKAGTLAICISFLVILLGSGIFLRAINPVIRKLEEREKELHFERNKFLGILDSMQDGVYIVDENHDIEYVNPALEQIFGTAERLKCYEYFHDRTEACPWCKNQEVFTGNTVRWEWYSSKNQRTYDLIDTPLKKSDGKISKLEIFRDVTDRKLAEEELQKARDELENRVEKRTAELTSSNEQLLLEIEERKLAEEKIWKARAMLRSVVDGISEPLLMLDTNLSVRMLNKAALKYYQLNDYQDAIDKPCNEVFKGESYPCAKCPVPSVISDGRNATYDRKGPFDPNRLEQVTIYPLQEESGEVTGCILRITDITKEKKVERQLIRADRLSSLGQLSGGIAHEIRNPLAGINLFVDVLCDEDKFVRTDKELEIFEEIKNNINRIDGIIRGILDFSKDSDAVIAEIDLNSLIEEILKLWHEKMRDQEIRLQLSLEEDIPIVSGDPIGIQQVVNNLVYNAVEAMEGGGLLQISTQKGVSSFNKDCPILKIQIQDTGPGIAPDLQEKVFNPFFTTKHTGTGLGLSISHQIVERHGGIISLESKPDELTTFQIELPVTPKN